MGIARRLPLWRKTLAALLVAGSLAGCDQPEGTVQVNTGEAPLAAAYQVDLYADEGGLDLVDPQSIVDSGEVTFDGVPEGRWIVLIQAQNGDQTTIAYYRGKVDVQANETVVFDAGAYTPGVPGGPTPDSDTDVDSFGPDGNALLSAIWAPGVETLPAVAITTTIQNGVGEAEVVEASTAIAQSAPGSFQGCATALLAEQERNTVLPQTDDVTPLQDRPAYGSLAPGETIDFFIATTFQETTCARVLNDSQTEHCLIFAEVLEGGGTVIDEATALEIAKGWDVDNPFKEGGGGVYEDTRARVGSEWVTNPPGGRDEDERVILVFLTSDSIGGQGFFGFFRPQDEQSREVANTSNEGEIIFVNGDRANDDLYDALGTLSHEFTHLILWNSKVGQNGTLPEGAPSENITIDEGMAVLNEDQQGFTFTGVEGGNFFLLASVQDLLLEGLNRPFFQFQGGLDDYGAGYLLCRYLLDQYGDETMLGITTSTAVGRENIATVTGVPFLETFGNFVQAVALNGQPDLPPELSYDGLDLHTTYTDRDGETFPMDGLQGIDEVELPGNLEQEVNIEPWGTVFYQATGGDGSKLTFKATGVDNLLTQIYDALSPDDGGGETPSPTPTPDPTPDPTP